MAIKKVSKKSDKSSQVSPKEPRTMEELLARYQIALFKKGDIVEGVITSLSPKEVLIDLGAKSEGTVFYKELPYIKDFLSQLGVGDRIGVYILSPENENGQIVVSLRRAAFGFKWQNLAKMRDQGELAEVKALESNRGGLLVEYEGLRGFLPASQLNVSHLGKAAELVGKTLKVRVIDVDSKINRLIFSEKHKDSKALDKIKVDQVYEGVVTGVFPFGIFVDVDGAEGLVHISEVSWEKITDLKNSYAVGDRLKVLVLGQDKESQRLTLSIKQLTVDPWNEIIKKYPVGKQVKGRVTKLTNFGAFVSLDNNIEGLIHISKIPPEKQFTAGEEVSCLIESVDTKKRRISLGLVLKEKPIGYK